LDRNSRIPPSILRIVDQAAVSKTMASQETLVDRDAVPAVLTDKEGSGPERTDFVDWDSPNDPENPMNWPKWKKIGHVALVSIIVFLV
jgi:hypothetical protein